MSTPLKQLSEKFKNLISLNQDIEQLHSELENKLNKLRDEYSNFRKQI